MKFKNSTLWIRVATVFVALLASCLGLWGQATTASSVVGQVTDSTNAAVPGAEVTLTDLGTKIAKKVSTNEDGRYIFTNVDLRQPAFSKASGDCRIVQSVTGSNIVKQSHHRFRAVTTGSGTPEHKPAEDSTRGGAPRCGI
jgi:hypothetical protein